MSGNDTNGFSVLKMASAYASENEMDAKDLFKKDPKPKENESQGAETTPVKKPWTPDAKLTEGMDELNAAPTTYSKDELIVNEDHELKNIADENALQSSRQAMDEMTRQEANIEDAKKRFGIKHLQIPEGDLHQVQIVAAAGDNNYKRSKARLDEIFQEIVDKYPEFIRDWIDPSKHQVAIPNPDTSAKVTGMEEHQQAVEDNKKITHCNHTENMKAAMNNMTGKNQNEIPSNLGQDIKIDIDKRNVSEISWNKEEIEKIRKSRSIELNIVENEKLEYTEIKDLDDNTVDAVLSQYKCKVNDVTAPLPASKYRATFTGLTYTEILDLSHSQDLNDLDGEKKKWSIAFDHIKNPSIGPWEEYQWYISPKTHEKVILPITATSNPEDAKMHKHTKFIDFLSKTSWLDLEFILWKTLCATAMDKEIISIECHAELENKKQCNNNYDWMYSPEDLLINDSITPIVLEEMQKTLNVSTLDDITANYKEAMLNTNNSVVLPHSKFSVLFGHVSAYEYLEHIYGEMNDIPDEEKMQPSEAWGRRFLTVIKGFLVPNGTGGYGRIKGSNNIIKVSESLDEVDYQTLGELVRLMISPYQFKFALRDIRCPKCKHKSSINIESMAVLLFIVARSLSNVNVVLKRM